MTKNNKKGKVKQVVKQPTVKSETKKSIEESFNINEYPEFLDVVDQISEEPVEKVPETEKEIISEYSPLIFSETPVNEIPEIIKLPEETPKKRTIESLTRNELRFFQRTGIMPT